MHTIPNTANLLAAALQHALDAERLAAAHAERLSAAGRRLAALLDEHDAEPRTALPSDLPGLLDQLAELLDANASELATAHEAAEESARLAGEAQIEADEERARAVPCCIADADEDGECYHGYATPARGAARRRRRR